MTIDFGTCKTDFYTQEFWVLGSVYIAVNYGQFLIHSEIFLMTSSRGERRYVASISTRDATQFSLAIKSVRKTTIQSYKEVLSELDMIFRSREGAQMFIKFF